MTEKLKKEDINLIKSFVKRIHRIATDYDPDANIRNEADIEYIIFNSLRNFKKLNSNDKIAAYFLYEIATKHPFYDGNKRTALMCCLIFKKIGEKNGLSNVKKDFSKYMNYKDDKIVKFIVEIATYKHKYEDVLKFVEEMLK